MGQILARQESGTRVITISAPGRLNAWTRAMRADLSAALADAAADPSVSGVVFTGDDGAFCAGQDFNEVVTWGSDTEWISEIHELYRQVLTLPKPVVAAVNGVAAGSGLQFALLCDYRVASREARMGQTEVRWGLASVTGTWLLEEVVGPLRARTLALSAELLPAGRLLAEGIVDAVEAPDQVLRAALAQAELLASYPSATFAATKGWCYERLRPRLDQAFRDAHTLHHDAFEAGVSREGAERFLARHRAGTAR
ncbi:enoyl-CoA hydratase/isomerase family protein [Nonomuraea rhizosphaerae]|uniref:enoyl-CoA hydratase/isomerase family protein n=1 Tax=Nonomuraea rhizosphaerae TaxID=2665663 RepID=UPI001C5F399F|nr:enoyl-CoA hydratase/isomerase family protein [Nonomuraea rhizosphaerae]